MKLDRRIRELPWPERGTVTGTADFKVRVKLVNAGGTQYMVATFTLNEEKLRRAGISGAEDFRLVCRKKQPAVRVLRQGAVRTPGKNMTLGRVMADTVKASPSWCYPEIDPEDEARLRSWLRAGEQTRNHYMNELNDWTHEAVDAERERRAKMPGKIADGDVRLCPEELPRGLVEFVRDVVLPEDDVLIYKKGNLRGLCYQCGEQVRTTRAASFKQDCFAVCPNCGRRVRCFREGGERFANDYVEDVATLQRGTDGKTVFIRQWHVCRDRTAKWENIPGQLEEVARYAVRGTQAAKWQIEGKENYYMQSWRYRMEDWTRVTNVSEVYDGTCYFFCPEGWRRIVAGTSLQYVELEDYIRGQRTGRKVNPIRFLLDWARYPAVEKLWKAGYTGLVYEKARGLGQRDRYVLKWSRESIREAVPFPARLLKLMEPEDWTMDHMRRCAELWKLAAAGAIRESEIREWLVMPWELDLLKAAMGHATAYKIAKNLRRWEAAEQAEREANTVTGWRGYGELRTAQTYRDYLADCEALGLDLDDPAVLFPRDLEAAHARTIAMVKHQANEALKKDFDRAVKRLNRWRYADGGLLIRPAASGDELTYEGAYLSHCVGGYADRMAKGETAVFLIRRASEPETPYYTLELRDGQVIQCRTAHNRSYEQDEAVRAFVERWMAKVVKKKAGKKAA